MEASEPKLAPAPPPKPEPIRNRAAKRRAARIERRARAGKA